MIKVKIDKNKRGEPIFKLGYKELDDKELRFLKRAIMEGKEIKGMFKYEIPLRFFIPIFSLTDKKIEFRGKNRLLQRPQKIYEEIFKKQNLFYHIGLNLKEIIQFIELQNLKIK